VLSVANDRRIHPVLRAVAVTLLIGLPVLDSSSVAQAVDDIIAKNLAAKGGAEKLRAVESVKTTGRLKTPRGDLPVTNWTKRPNMMRREVVADGQTQVVAFDGKTLWGINPLMSPGPQAITGPAVERTRMDADDFDSVLLDYRQKGHQVGLIAAAPGAASSGPHLRVTKKNGSVQDIYLNPETFLEEKITMEINQEAPPGAPGVQGRKAVVATELSDYRTVDGMMVPFRIRQTFNGKPQGEVAYEQVQFNLPIGDELFRMPAK
jgi:outer membrane lipoprotein-sorting protein